MYFKPNSSLLGIQKSQGLSFYELMDKQYYIAYGFI